MDKLELLSRGVVTLTRGGSAGNSGDFAQLDVQAGGVLYETLTEISISVPVVSGGNRAKSRIGDLRGSFSENTRLVSRMVRARFIYTLYLMIYDLCFTTLAFRRQAFDDGRPCEFAKPLPLLFLRWQLDGVLDLLLDYTPHLASLCVGHICVPSGMLFTLGREKIHQETIVTI